MINFAKNKQVSFGLAPFPEECIPYACHYNDFSLITKNGELLQVIKVESIIGDEKKIDKDVDLRQSIRDAIKANVKDHKISISFHTIRRKRNLDSINQFSWSFARDTHEAWAKKNYWREKFVNEIYISFLFEGEDYGESKKIYLSLIPNLLKKAALSTLEQKAKTIDNIVGEIQNKLSAFGAQRLKVSHDRFGAHSEILEFIAKIVCLKTKRISLPVQGIDNIFKKSKVAFGGNVLEVLDEKEKRFAAIFSLKEYHEVPFQNLDPLLRVASEFVITQTVDFIDAKEAKKSFEYMEYILTKVSKDEELYESSGLKSLSEGNKNSLTDYCSGQMTLMIIGQSLLELSRSVSNVFSRLKVLGIAAVREDLNISLCFWSQLPGNFSFFRRKHYIDSNRIASFASLYNSPSGRTKNIWGSALTIFRQETASPHFFNLHVSKNGHTMVVGQKESNKHVLVNFLLSESSKYDPRVLYIDQYSNSCVTIQALGGRYAIISLDSSKQSLRLNPFAMQDTEENRSFLKKWTLLLLSASASAQIVEAQRVEIENAVNALFANIAEGDRQISSLLDFIENQEIKTSLSVWCRPNKLGVLFDNKYDEIGRGAKMLGINVESLASKDNQKILPVFISYCMYQFSRSLDKSPSIVILRDANFLLDNAFFAEFLPTWLDYLLENNSLAMLQCNSKFKINQNIVAIQPKIATHLFFPEIEPKTYQTAFNLSDNEVKRIKAMKALYRHFMVKQQDESIVLELNLDGLDNALKALYGNKEALEAMEKAIKTVGDNPNRWIANFYNHFTA